MEWSEVRPSVRKGGSTATVVKHELDDKTLNTQCDRTQGRRIERRVICLYHTRNHNITKREQIGT